MKIIDTDITDVVIQAMEEGNEPGPAQELLGHIYYTGGYLMGKIAEDRDHLSTLYAQAINRISPTIPQVNMMAFDGAIAAVRVGESRLTEADVEAVRQEYLKPETATFAYQVAAAGLPGIRAHIPEEP